MALALQSFDRLIQGLMLVVYPTVWKVQTENSEPQTTMSIKMTGSMYTLKL